MRTDCETPTQGPVRLIWSGDDSGAEVPSLRSPDQTATGSRDVASDFTGYISKIELAAKLLSASAKRIRELEKDRESQTAEATKQIDAALGRSKELEQQIAIERSAAASARALAVTAEKQARELEAGIAAAFSSLDKLSAVMTRAFPGGLEGGLFGNESVAGFQTSDSLSLPASTARGTTPNEVALSVSVAPTIDVTGSVGFDAPADCHADPADGVVTDLCALCLNQKR